MIVLGRALRARICRFSTVELASRCFVFSINEGDQRRDVCGAEIRLWHLISLFGRLDGRVREELSQVGGRKSARRQLRAEV
jgi:hypothetical protein